MHFELQLLRFEINWASLIVGSKCTVLALFYFVFEGNFPSTVPWGLYLEGRFNREFFALPVWASYIWRGLFSEFYGISMLPTIFSGKGIQLRSPTTIYIY